jgi:methylglutaconyl-CoA hydratase
MADAVKVQQAGAVVTLTMDQPERRNVLTAALLDQLGDALVQAADDPHVRVVVLTHTGPAFCAGADLSGAGGTSPGSRRDLAEVLSLLMDCPKPVVARIAGHAMGGGVGLAAACDLSIAALDARFGFTEVRVGVAPAVISVVCLPKLRRSDALELFLTGARIDAARAASIGLVTRAVAANQLDAEVAALVDQLCLGGPTALAAAKRLVFAVPSLERTAAFTHTSAVSRDLFASPEAAEGMAAFGEKRLPSWAMPGGEEG